MISCNRWQQCGTRARRGSRVFEMRISNAGLAVVFLATLCLLPACGDACKGHKYGDVWCSGSTILQCYEGAATPLESCAPNACFEGQCILDGITCPTDTLGYQCLGERKVWCLDNGMVEDQGACPTYTDGIMYSVQGPYCVENPGGAILACGWKKERCTTEDEVRCFDDGSASCAGNVYQAFVPNEKASQATCIDTPVANCWGGKTWCEGDVLKRCDICKDAQTCGSITIEATCSAGGCVPYPRPPWMVESLGKNDTMYGCVLDSPACDGSTGMACMGDTAATCIGNGLAVGGLSCTEVQVFLGNWSSVYRTKYGSSCVERPSQGDAICAYDPAPCAVEGATRCAPTDASGVMLETCKDGVWLYRETCANRSQKTTMCQAVASGAYCK